LSRPKKLAYFTSSSLNEEKKGFITFDYGSLLQMAELNKMKRVLRRMKYCDQVHCVKTFLVDCAKEINKECCRVALYLPMLMLD
jgi:hypothetical protein